MSGNTETIVNAEQQLFSVLKPEQLKTWMDQQQQLQLQRLHEQPSISSSTNRNSNSPPDKTVPLKFIIIDVRGSDFLYGKIPNALNIPCKYFNKYAIQDLLKKYPWNEGYKYVFHCMRSQNRGPRAAKKFCEFVTSLEELETDVDAVTNRVFLLQGGLKRWNELYGDVLIQEI